MAKEVHIDDLSAPAQQARYTLLSASVQAIVSRGLARASVQESLEVVTECVKLGAERASLAMGKTAVSSVSILGVGVEKKRSNSNFTFVVVLTILSWSTR